MMKKIIFTIFLVFTFFGTKAQDNYLKNSDEAKALSQKVTELFKEKKITEAFNELDTYWPIPENELEGLAEKTIKYMNLLEDRFGKVEGIIKVKEEKIKDIAIRETYFIRHEYSAIRLVFTYYKNDKGWILNAFNWDDSFTKEFE